MLIHLDYVWVDGFSHPSIRSKTKLVTLKSDDGGNADLPIVEWNFDGSSTGQATTGDSERILVPQRVYQIADNHYATLCEVCLPDENRTPHSSNYRALLREALEAGAASKEIWIGFEQEYFYTEDDKNIFLAAKGRTRKGFAVLLFLRRKREAS